MFTLVLLVGFVCAGLDQLLLSGCVLSQLIQSLLVFQALRRTSGIDQLGADVLLIEPHAASDQDYDRKLNDPRR